MSGQLQVASECRFSRNDELLIALAARIWDLVEESIERDDKPALVLSGGGTPVSLYNVLRELPLPWPSMELCLSDERWVPVDDAASNEGMLERELIVEPGPASFLSMARTADTAEADASRVDSALQERSKPWDLVLLGMGNDGHTASLFPGARGLANALGGQRRCEVVEPADSANVRLTLTLPELLNSRRIILLLRGEQKWRDYLEALAGDDVNAMPVRAVLFQRQVPVDVYWSLD